MLFRYKNNSSFVISGIGVILATGLLVAGNASAANLLTNGSFESGLSPWTFSLGDGVQGIQYQDGGTHTDGNWSEEIQAWSPASAVAWGARLSQGGISLAAGQVVTVTFAAMASTTGPLTAGIQQTSGAWSWYGLQSFSLTPYWQICTFSFTMPSNDSNTSLNFEMGNMGGNVWIDNVSVTVVSGASAATATTSLALGDSPNFNYGNTLEDPNLTALTQDSNEISRKFAFMVGFSAWTNSGTPVLFSDTQPTMDALTRAGYQIVLTWCAQDAQVPGNIDPNYNYAAIISGQHDAYIRQWAQSAAAWGTVFYVRLFHEMNGDWYPWGINVNGNSPALAIQAWQHVYNIFQSVGATNVKFMWCPNVRAPVWPDPNPLASFYPGDDYVSWLGMDGYNWGLYGEQNWDIPWYTFTQVFQQTYNEIVTTVSSARPVMVAETASGPGSGATDKATWITQMENDAPTLFPNIQAVSYYDSNITGGTWRFDADPFSLQAFTALAADSRWQGILH
jgi:beta-mannanase